MIRTKTPTNNNDTNTRFERTNPPSSNNSNSNTNPSPHPASQEFSFSQESNRMCPICKREEEPSGPGNPPKYKDGYADLAYKMSLMGLTNEDLAETLQVSTQTIHNWRERHPRFFDAIKAGKEDADARVAESLFHKARGYSMPEEKIFMHNGTPVRVETTKRYAPDTTAAIFWLCNRQPDRWRHVNRVEITGQDGGPIELERRFHVIQEIIQNPEARQQVADQWREDISGNGDGSQFPE